MQSLYAQLFGSAKGQGMQGELTTGEFNSAHILRFSSFGQLIETVELECKKNPGYAQQNNQDSDADFCRTENMKAYLDLARKGWAEGRKRIEEMVKQIEAHESFTAIRETWLYDVAGHSLDIARFCAGEPEQWGTPLEEMTEGASSKIINLYLHVGATANVKQSAMFNRAAMIAALANVLENCGFRVAVTTVTCSERACNGGSRACVTYTQVKTAEQPLDLERLAIAIHPSTFRRAIFTMYNVVSGGPRTASSSYGRTRMHPVSKIETLEPGAILINSNEGYLSNDHERIEWIKQKSANVSAAIADKVSIYE